jgi:hypothetical protein
LPFGHIIPCGKTTLHEPQVGGARQPSLDVCRYCTIARLVSEAKPSLFRYMASLERLIVLVDVKVMRGIFGVQKKANP